MELLKILKYLDKKFPEKTIAPWDKSGFQLYDSQFRVNPHQEINRIFITLDLTVAAFKKAMNHRAQLIITRHPFIFNDLEQEQRNPNKKILIKELRARNVFIYSIHSNYDASPQNNLLELINQKMKIHKHQRIGNDREGLWLSLRDKIKPCQFINQWQTIFPQSQLLQSKNWKSSPLRDFYLVAGAGGETMMKLRLKETTFVTGELKWHHWLYALDNQIQVLALGHDMENHFVPHLAILLKNVYPTLEVSTYLQEVPFVAIGAED